MSTSRFQFAKGCFAKAGIALAILFHGPMGAQQVIDLAPARAPDAPAIAQLLKTPHQGSDTGVTLRILNMPVDSEATPLVNLSLQRSRSVTAQTQFVVIDEQGQQQPLEGNVGERYTGTVEGDPDTTAFVSISPEGEIRSILYQDGETIVSHYQPGSQTTVSATTSRAVDIGRDFSQRSFQCGSDHLEPAYLLPKKNFATPLSPFLSRPQVSHSIVQANTQQRRRADIILDTDLEFFRLFGDTTAAANYAADLLSVASGLYEKEVNTRLNLVKVIIRSASNGPYTASDSEDLLYQLRDYWNDDSRNTDRSLPRHHVHLLSGKRTGGGVTYVHTLPAEAKRTAYGMSGGLRGNFDPRNPQVIWDSVVMTHELGHAFGSSHTHSFDSPHVELPTSKDGGAIDCCYADTNTSQCGRRNGGAGVLGVLPGVNSISGGSPGGATGTIMSYCHLLNGGDRNMAWSFGANHSYGVNPGRVPELMTAVAQTFLPVDNGGGGGGGTTAVPLRLLKEGTGTGSIAVNSLTCSSSMKDGCAADFDSGTKITMQATPDAGSVFAGWGGGICSGTGTCSFTLTQATTITATFNLQGGGGGGNVVNLNVALTGAGRIAVDPSDLDGYTAYVNDDAGTITDPFPYTRGTRVTLSATPDSGWSFAGWQGACSGQGACAITMNGDQSVRGTFVRGNGGGGSGSCQAGNFTRSQERMLDVFIAYYGRPGDSGGLDFWSKLLDAMHGDIWAIVEAFADSKEYKDRFGHLGQRDLVNNLYQQMFARAADGPGLNWYAGQLQSGKSTLAEIALEILDGAQNSDAAVMENRRKVSRHYIVRARAKARDPLSPQEMAQILATVTASPATADAACQQFTNLVNSR